MSQAHLHHLLLVYPLAQLVQAVALVEVQAVVQAVAQAQAQAVVAQAQVQVPLVHQHLQSQRVLLHLLHPHNLLHLQSQQVAVFPVQVRVHRYLPLNHH